MLADQQSAKVGCGNGVSSKSCSGADDGDGEEDEEDDATAESPLLPIKEDCTPETNNNNNNNSSSNNHNHPSNGFINNISTKVLHQAATATSTAGNVQLYTPVDTSSSSPASKRSLEFYTAPGTPLSIASAISECRRRSSITALPRLEHATNAPSPNAVSDAATDATITIAADQYDYSAPGHSPTRTHSHSYNLYPHDTFAKLEGKAAKPSTKMQSKVDAVGQITGQWGKWQLRTVLLIFLCKIPSSWFMACIIFTAPAPRHGEFFCKPPNTIGAQNQTQWIKVSHPQKEEADDQEFSIDFCNVFEDAQQHAHHYYNYDKPELEPKIWEEPTSRNANVIPCQQFHHQAEFHSVITQYDLVCSRDILVSVTQFFHLFGVLTGGILANHLLKYFSPRNVMLFGMITQIFCGNLTGHVASYELHVFFRCLSAVCCAQMYTAGGMIMADITGGKYKTCVSTLFEQFWSIGVMLLPGVASFFSSWSHLYMAISWPTVILIYLWQWIPDSPRWMIARGRVLDAKRILQQCIEVNGTRHSLPHDIDQQLELQAQTAMDAPPPAGWWSLWKGEKAKRHMVCVHLCWSIYIVVYYGMLLNIRSFSREHLEINTAIAGLCEMIGTFIGLFLILKTTRKWLWTGLFNVVAGCIAYLGWLVPQDMSVNGRVALLMLSAMVSKTAISTTLSILTTCTVELVSDDKKKICSFSTICWARFWLLGAPFIGATVIFGQLVPQTAFASLAIAGGFISALISSPRTLPKETGARATQNMATATHMRSGSLDGEGIDNKGFTKGSLHIGHSGTAYPIFTSITKMTTPQSNLPPQLMPGIWTTKNHEDSPNV